MGEKNFWWGKTEVRYRLEDVGIHWRILLIRDLKK
jgi:hypothetical protein